MALRRALLPLSIRAEAREPLWTGRFDGCCLGLCCCCLTEGIRGRDDCCRAAGRPYQPTNRSGFVLKPVKRDSAAAAAVSCGLLLLGPPLENSDQRARCRSSGRRLFESPSSPRVLSVVPFGLSVVEKVHRKKQHGRRFVNTVQTPALESPTKQQCGEELTPERPHRPRSQQPRWLAQQVSLPASRTSALQRRLSRAAPMPTRSSRA